MFKTKKLKSGYALVASLIVSSLVVTTIGVVMYKITSNTKDIVRVRQREQALHIAEEGIEHALHYINDKNKGGDRTPPITEFGLAVKSADGNYPSSGQIILKGVKYVSPNSFQIAKMASSNVLDSEAKSYGATNLYSSASGIVEGGAQLKLQKGNSR